ncbi:hypothetical protein AKO1_007753 [Acrasis kona]|uniref:BRCT domain-containing protein n=1 Tax=Acrasis kona TaxID=1008807 RepID=A0AAW2YRG9_9EUKA
MTTNQNTSWAHYHNENPQDIIIPREHHIVRTSDGIYNDVIEYVPNFIQKRAADRFRDVWLRVEDEGIFKAERNPTRGGTACLCIGLSFEKHTNRISQSKHLRMLKESKYYEEAKQSLIEICSFVKEELQREYAVLWRDLQASIERLPEDAKKSLCVPFFPQVFVNLYNAKSIDHLDKNDSDVASGYLLCFKSDDCRGGELYFSQAKIQYNVQHGDLVRAVYKKLYHKTLPIFCGRRISVVVPFHQRTLSYNLPTMVHRPEGILSGTTFHVLGRSPNKDNVITVLNMHGALVYDGSSTHMRKPCQSDNHDFGSIIAISLSTSSSKKSSNLRTCLKLGIPIVEESFINFIYEHKKLPETLNPFLLNTEFLQEVEQPNPTSVPSVDTIYQQASNLDINMIMYNFPFN